MTKDEICGLLRQIHDVLAMQSETNHWAQPYAMGYAEGFNDACKPKQGEPVGKLQEPFGYFKAEPFGWTDCAETDEGAIALYEVPPQRTWIGLTDEEIQNCWDGDLSPYQMQCIREIEAKLKEKNNG